MKTKTKRIFCFLAAIILSALVLVLPCFAWGYDYTDYNSMACPIVVYNGDILIGVGWVGNGNDPSVASSWQLAIDFNNLGDSSPSDWSFYDYGGYLSDSIVEDIFTSYYESVVSSFGGSSTEVDLTPYKQHIINTTLEDLRFVVTYLNTTSHGQSIVNEAIPNFNYQEQVNAINSQTTLNGLFTLDSSYSTALVYLVSDTFDRYMEIVSQPTYQDGYTVGYEQGFLAGEQSQGAYTSGYNTGYSTGYNEGYNTGYSTGFGDGVIDIGGERYDEGYRDGYTDGGKDSGYMKNYLITIFSSPYYILNEVFDFEILGINVATVIMFILSIIIVGFVIKLII